VKVLRVNRNALLIMDSDKTKSGQKLTPTKKRIISEMESLDEMVRVTAGKEVENYIPVDALRSFYSLPDLEPLEQYADICEYLDGIEAGEGNRFIRNKVPFARKITPLITRESMKQVHDLEKKINEAHARILTWNGISPA
jgi:putative ATP-dependent endonuclease of OLD family